ncbi:hypothetical protein A2U01_0011522 [Trifolium medium]|uniref:Uncharacterized protein n=1 Tax=Trifolium medium TaxID=97028 RepID=A0A392MWF2_9FABA|nr:hypothetical protein [Trifolium medium]
MHLFLNGRYNLSFNHLLTYALPLLDINYLAEGQPEAAVGNQPANDADRAIENENENVPEAAGRGNGGNQWWGIVKEIQMIVFGFITSLLPGFHNHMD